MKSKKGQIAVEFISYTAVFMLIAMGAFILTFFMQNTEYTNREGTYLYEYITKYSSAPFIAYKGGEGFIYSVYFDPNIEGYNYKLTYTSKIFSTRGGGGFFLPGPSSSSDDSVSLIAEVDDVSGINYSYVYVLPNLPVVMDSNSNCPGFYFKSSSNNGNTLNTLTFDSGKVNSGFLVRFKNMGDRIEVECR